MFMTCNSKMNKQKKIIMIILFSVVGGVTYLSFTTHNPTFAIIAPLLLALAPCLIMCGAIGGSMWFVNKASKKKVSSSHSYDLHNPATQKKDDTKT